MDAYSNHFIVAYYSVLWVGYGLNKLNTKIMFKWIKLIRWVRAHRKKGNGSFDVVTNSDTFIITVCGCDDTRDSWNENMLRIKY